MNHIPTSKTITFDLYPETDGQKRLAAEYVELRKRQEEISRQLHVMYNASDQVKAARAIVQGSFNKHGGTKHSIDATMVGTYFRVKLNVFEDQQMYDPSKKPLYMDPKTVNLLLNGKLYSDEQKKALLKVLHPQLTELQEEATE